MNERSGPWRRRDFRLIWAGGLVNDTGDWLLMVALPVYVLTETGSGVQTALLFIAQLAPAVLLGAFAGNLVDRWNLRLTVVATNIAQAVTLLPLLAVTADRTWPAFVVTVGQGALTRFNNPANAALLLRVVDVGELQAANGARAMGENLARLVGSPLGGIVVAVGGLRAVVAVDGLSFLVVAAATFAVRSDARAARPATPVEHDAPGGTGAGLRVLRGTRPLPALFATTTLSQVSQGMFVVLFLAFVVRRLDGGGTEIGIIRGAQAVGAITAGVVLARPLARAAPSTLIGLGFGGMAVWGFVTWNLPALTTATAVYAALMAIAGSAAIACNVGLTTAVQRATPAAYFGLCVGTLETGGAIGQAIGAVGAGLLLDRVPLTGLLEAQSTIYVLTAVLGVTMTRVDRAARFSVGPLGDAAG